MSAFDDLKEVHEVVSTINDEIMESGCCDAVLEEYGQSYDYLCEVQSYGDEVTVSFLGMQIWDSINDERTWIPVENPALNEDDEVQEPLDIHIRREMAKRIKVIASFPTLEKF